MTMNKRLRDRLTLCTIEEVASAWTLLYFNQTDERRCYACVQGPDDKFPWEALITDVQQDDSSFHGDQEDIHFLLAIAGWKDNAK